MGMREDRARHDREQRADRAAEGRHALERDPAGVRPGDWDHVLRQEQLAKGGR